MSEAPGTLPDLNSRSREIFRQLVETYLETGEPVGSRTLSKQLRGALSSASIRNVMQDLEQAGLLDSPHVSAGRRPTHQGLRLFVDGLLGLGALTEDEQRRMEETIGAGGEGAQVSALLSQAGDMLSGLSGAASLVFSPRQDSAVKHIDFVELSDTRLLVVLVKNDDSIENRLIDAPPGLTSDALRAAANFLNAQLRGRTLAEAHRVLGQQIEQQRRELGEIASRLVDAGVATWTSAADSSDAAPERLIVRGQANLLSDAELADDIDRMRRLFDDLERKRDLAQLVDLADAGQGVRVFIGAENRLFSLAGSSLIISPYMNAEARTVGAIGVIGPTRMNYGRIVPIVDYTAQLVSRLVSDAAKGGG